MHLGATGTAIAIAVVIFGVPAGTAIVTNVGMASIAVIAEMTVVASALASLGLAAALGAEEYERLAQEWQEAFDEQPMTDLGHRDRLEVIWARRDELQALIDNSNAYLAIEEAELEAL